VAAATQRVLDASGVKIEWEILAARAENTDKKTIGAEVLNTAAIESVRRNRVALKGPMATAIAGGARSVNVALRKSLDLYANLRPVKNLPGVKSHFDGVDVVIVRENTEDLYSGLEHEVVPGVVESLKIITEKASTRIAKFAFEYARKMGRKKIHAIHKANIMKLSDGLFLHSVRAVAEKYKDIEYKELIVDNACMQIVINPDQFDVLLLPNLYGDVMSDLAAGLVGGLGVVPSGNIGLEAAIFEAVHGTAPDIAGKGLANPTALLMSSILMLNHLGEPSAAERIEKALIKVYKRRQTRHERRGRQSGDAGIYGCGDRGTAEGVAQNPSPSSNQRTNMFIGACMAWSRSALPLSLAILAVLNTARTSASELKPRTAKAFQHYEEVTETRIQGELSTPGQFLYLDTLPESQRAEEIDRLKSGQVYGQVHHHEGKRKQN